jgi:septal ring factor EnvC (AmiA/AmiB activator)
VGKQSNSRSSLLNRQQELSNLQSQLKQQQTLLNDLQVEIKTAKTQSATLSGQRVEQAAALAEMTQQNAGFNSNV